MIGGVTFAAFTMLAMPRLLAPLARWAERDLAVNKPLNHTLLAIVVGLFMLSAFTADFIGLQAGVIGPALFSILVLMAIVTTLMASPVFELVYGRQARASGELAAVDAHS